MFAALLDLLFPPACASCGASLRDADEAPFCAVCANSGVERMPARACVRCGEAGARLSPARECERCVLAPPAFATAWSPYLHSGAVRTAIARAKFGGQESACGPLAACLARACLERRATAAGATLGDVACVVPVPLHPSRIAQRGFDQVRPLARAVARALGVRTSSALRRVRATPPQTALDAEQRALNLQGAFAARSALPNVAVLLVDDVLTTGCTASACAVALLEAGARCVDVVTLARATHLDT